MSRILKDLPWENILAATLTELEEEARAHVDVDQFNVEDEFEAEDVLEVLIQQIQNFRPDLPRYVASNMVSQLFRGNGYIKTPKGPRPLSKTARREHVADRILRQLALQMGAHDPEFDITEELNVNYSVRPRAERRAEVEDDGLTVIQRVTRSFGTDELDRILYAYHVAFGNEIDTNETLLSLFTTFRENAFFYSPVLFVSDIENKTKSVLEASLKHYILSARFDRLDAIDKTSLLLRAYLDLKTPGVQTIDVWNTLLRDSMVKSEIIKSKLNVPPKSSLLGLSQLDKPKSAAPMPAVSPPVAHIIDATPKKDVSKPVPVLEEILGMDDIGEMVAWLQWTFEDEIEENSNLRLLMDDLIFFDNEQLALPVAFSRIKMAAADALEISSEELGSIFDRYFATKTPHIELAFHMMAIIRGKSLLAVHRPHFKSIVQDATFRTLLRLSDAAHDYQSEARMVERMLIADEDPSSLDAEVYDFTSDEEPVVLSALHTRRSGYTYPIQPQPWHKPRLKFAFQDRFFESEQNRFSNLTQTNLGQPSRQSPEVRSILRSTGLNSLLMNNMMKPGLLGM